MLPKFLLDRIREYIDRNFIEDDGIPLSDGPADLAENCLLTCTCEDSERVDAVYKSAAPAMPSLFKAKTAAGGAAFEEIEALIKDRDESFSSMLLRMIDERGWKDSYCYKKANLTRAHFNRIKNEPDYRIGKGSACALALALELRVPEAEDFLKRAGYSLSDASKSDLIIRYCLIHGIYNIDTVNEILYSFDQALLGAK